MGKITNNLDKVKKLLTDLKLPESGLMDSELVKVNQPLYNEIIKILNESISSEEAEELEITRLIESLKNYKKHLEFTKILLDRDFTNDGIEDEVEFEKVSKRKPDFHKDIINAKKQVDLAEIEWNHSKKIIKHLVDSGKIKVN